MNGLKQQVMHENDGQVPEEMTIADIMKMKELEIYNWEQYEREQEKIRLFRIKQENPREVAKIAQTREYWEKELQAGKIRRIAKGE